MMTLNPITGKLDITIGTPASALDNETVVFDGATGKKIKAGSGLIITANLMQASNKAVLLSGITGGTPASGAGTRMMWVPAKGAFRAGIVSADEWDNANVGLGSVAFGKNGKASSFYSAHFGYGGEASSFYSVHFGQGGKASGLWSAHFGKSGEASGTCSLHFGEKGKALGAHSWVGGKYMQLSSTATSSFAWGHHISAVALTQPNTFYIFPGGTAGKVAVGTTTPATSAIMDLTSTTGALLLPRMTTAQRDALTGVNGMVIYSTTNNRLEAFENGVWVDL